MREGGGRRVSGLHAVLGARAETRYLPPRRRPYTSHAPRMCESCVTHHQRIPLVLNSLVNHRPPSPRHILCPVASPPRIPFPPSAFPLSSTRSTQCKTFVSMKNKKLVSRRILPIESNSLETSASLFDLNRRPILYPTFILIFR